MNYVLGFAFTTGMEELVLIKKTKPEWQAGLLNGVGGKVESYDNSFHEAMSREFHEETGVQTDELDWTYFASLKQEGEYEVQCFCLAMSDVADQVKTTTEEHVQKYWTQDIPRLNTVSNLKWLVPMAYVCLYNRNKFSESMEAVVNYKGY